jgi:hypothetical protein
MTLVQDENVIENFPSERSHKAFRKRVHVWCAHRGPHRSCARREEDQRSDTAAVHATREDSAHRGSRICEIRLSEHTHSQAASSERRRRVPSREEAPTRASPAGVARERAALSAHSTFVSTPDSRGEDGKSIVWSFGIP